MAYMRGIRMSRDGEPIPTPASIHKMMDEYLAERKKDNGGFAPVTEKEMEQLGLIIRGLICRKYQTDGDGDVPVEFELLDRTKEWKPDFAPLPYVSHRNSNPADYYQALRRASMNLSMAVDSNKRAMEQYDIVLREAEEARAKENGPIKG